MARIQIIRAAMDKVAVAPACEELSKFIRIHSPGIVQREHEKSFYLDEQLQRKAPELHLANAVVNDFLSNIGRKLAADFLGVAVDNVRCVKSFVILYCSRRTKRTTRGGGAATIFFALGDLSLSNGLPMMGDASPALNSGDALVMRSEETQTLRESPGGGIALVSDWI